MIDKEKFLKITDSLVIEEYSEYIDIYDLERDEIFEILSKNKTKKSIPLNKAGVPIESIIGYMSAIYALWKFINEGVNMPKDISETISTAKGYFTSKKEKLSKNSKKLEELLVENGVKEEIAYRFVSKHTLECFQLIEDAKMNKDG